MAFPSVQSVTASKSSVKGTTFAASYPATVNSGDLLIYAVGVARNGTLSVPTGLTAVTSSSGDAYGTFRVYKKVADGTEGGTTETFTFTASDHWSVQIFRLTGDNGITDVEENGSVTSGSSVNPISITTSWASDDNLWLLVIGTADEGELVTSWATNYTTNGLNNKNDQGANDSVNIATSYRTNAAQTEDAGTCSLAGSETIYCGTIAIRPDQSPSGVTGNLSAQETGADSAALTGDVLVSGDLAAQEIGSDTATLAGAVAVNGNLTAQETGNDVATINGSAPSLVSGDLAAQETGSDAAALTGNVLVAGDLAAQEVGSDVAVINGAVAVAGNLAAQEVGSDTAAFSGGGVPVTGDMVAHETGADDATINGTVKVTGTLSAQEAGSDDLVISGTVTITGTMVAHETGADDASLSGAVLVLGDLAAQEIGSDVAAFSYKEADLTGNLAAQETGSDTARFFATCLEWSQWSRSRERLNASTLRVFGETVILDSTGVAVPVKGVFGMPSPERDIGNAQYDTPQPYLMFKTSDIGSLNIAPRQKVRIRGQEFTVVSEPREDDMCMTVIDVRGSL